MGDNLITIQLQTLIKQGKWKAFCKMFGVSVNIIDMNLFNETDEWVLTKEQAKELGIK